jgi:hypothetical protein
LVNPTLELVDPVIGPGAVAGHLPAADGADDGVSVLDDVLVIEQIKTPESSSRGPSSGTRA